MSNDDRIIQSIHGHNPPRADEYPLYFKVGIDGVTEIREGGYAPEPYCWRATYDVYKNGQLCVRLYDAAIAMIIYTEPDHEQG